MKTLSLCMIVKNEEEVIDRCLSSCYKLFDEIIIVDTGSTDRTKEICRKYTDKIFEFVWCNDFSKARNFGIQKASSDYFMWLDADDVITNHNLKKLTKLKSELTDEDVVMIKYDISFDENNNSTFSYYRERIIKNNGKFLFQDPVHEAIVPSGKIIYKEISVEHRKIKENKLGRNLQIYESLDKTKFTARQTFYYSRELYFNNKIDDAIIYFNKFLNLEDGFFENKIDACNILSKCYQIKQDYNKAKEILIHSFNFDLPRAENLCELAYLYKNEQDYIKAIYYFKLASNCDENNNGLGFKQIDFYNFIPYIELCVCYSKLNDLKMALHYNNLAKKYKPNHSSVILNEKILQENLKNKK